MNDVNVSNFVRAETDHMFRTNMKMGGVKIGSVTLLRAPTTPDKQPVISKFLGSGLGARMAGLTNQESLQLGAGMTSRGEVGLIVVNVGVLEGLIGPGIFSEESDF